MLQCPCHFPPLERPQFVEVPEMDCKTRLLEMLPRACIMCVRMDRVERERERETSMAITVGVRLVTSL